MGNSLSSNKGSTDQPSDDSGRADEPSQPLARERVVHVSRSYGYSAMLNYLYWTNFTGTESFTPLCKQLRTCSCWVELPDGSLFFCGGYAAINSPSDEAWECKVRHDSAVIVRPKMIRKRAKHQAAYYNGFVYAISGPDQHCERFNYSSDCWESMPEILNQVHNATVVPIESKQALYVLGGGGLCDLVQVYHLRKAKWSTLDVKLPSFDDALPCFWLYPASSSFYFISRSKLYTFDTHSERIDLVQSLEANRKSWYGPCRYSDEVLYCANDCGNARQLQLSLGFD
jgi:hypothetical protein